jgi:hypothetical protein
MDHPRRLLAFLRRHDRQGDVALGQLFDHHREGEGAKYSRQTSSSGRTALAS